MKQAMIFCAGIGNRLKPITNTIPKPLVKVNGKPILQYTLDNIISYGIKDITINTHYLPEQINEFISQYKKTIANDINIKIIHEPELLGSGGGLKNACLKGSINPNEPVLAINGDIIWFDQDKKIYNKLLANWSNGKWMLVLIQPKNLSTGYYYEGDFDLDKNNIISKGLKYICPGIHIIYPPLVINHPKESFSLNELYYNNVEGVVNDIDYWLHIGDVKGLQEAENYIKNLPNPVLMANSGSVFPYFEDLKNFIPKTIEIKLNKKTYPVLVDGTGSIACLSVGFGTLLQRTLSSDFKKHFTVYSTDLYWTENYALEDISKITMQKIIDNIFSVITKLNLNKVFLIGHSAYGLIALEIAKRQDSRIQGIIMIGTPTACNPTIINQADDYFKKHSTMERRANDKMRKTKYEKIRKPSDSDICFNAYEAGSARYWGNMHISRDFLNKLWQDIAPDENISKLVFGPLLYEHDFLVDIEKVKVPVLLAGGKLDFDCIPLILWKDSAKPENFTIVDCGDAGHWPHYENYKVFDKEVIAWTKTQGF